MAYYDHIAREWHKANGQTGCPFKTVVLNDRLLQRIATIQDRTILELGAGNGYFLPLAFRRFSGQNPTGVIVTDASSRLVEIAREHFSMPQAGYQVLDVGHPFPFESRRFDLILATLIFNEVAPQDFRNALAECHRVLSDHGRLLITVTHPSFVKLLQKWRLLVHRRGGLLTAPGAGMLQLPLVIRSHEAYRTALSGAGFGYEEEEVYSNPNLLNIKPGVRSAKKVPRALVFECRKRHEAPASADPAEPQ